MSLLTRIFVVYWRLLELSLHRNMVLKFGFGLGFVGGFEGCFVLFESKCIYVCTVVKNQILLIFDKSR